MANKSRRKKPGKPSELEEAVQGLSTMAEDLAAVTSNLPKSNSQETLQLIYEHVQKMDDFLIELDKRVSALEERHGKSENTGTEGANAEASSYGSSSLAGSGLFNEIALLLLPMGAVVLFRIFRSRRKGSI